MGRSKILSKRILLKLAMLAVLILHTTGAVAAPQDFSFATPVFYAVGSRPFIVKTGDFNGDAKLDLVISNSDNNNVSILLGKGDGTFHPQVRYTTGKSPMGVAIGDFDSDGKPDLAVANRYDNNVLILKGNGDGTFGHSGFFPVGTEPVSVTTEDFNGDQKLDLAVANSLSNNISILLGKGDGTFYSQVTYPAGSQLAYVLTTDFNLDGKLDLAVGNVNAGKSKVSVLLGNGNGTFNAPQYYDVGVNPRLTAADFNGDGIPDLASANVNSNNVSVLIGRGDGTFKPQVTYPVGAGPIYIVSEDFDGDGILDLVTANGNTSYISILPGKGDGTFLSQVMVTACQHPFSIGVGDFNRDGKKDLAVTNYDGRNVGILINTNTTQANLPPVLAPIPDQTVDQGQLLQLVIRASDPNDDPLIYSAADLPEGASFDPWTQVFRWIPGYTQTGDFTVRFEVSDGSLTASREVVITVNKVNLPPVFNPIGDQTVNEGELLEFTVSATDPNDDPLTYNVSSLPVGAEFDPVTQTFTWIPDYNQAGVYTVIFQVSDGGLTVNRDLTVTVNQVNRPPVLDLIGNHWVDEGQTLKFTVNANDPDGDELTYSATGLPEAAGFDPATRLFSWTPDHGQAGTYTVTFQVNDGQITVARDVYIIVNRVNRAPELETIGDQTVDEGQLLEFDITANDPDGDELTYTATGLPEGAGFDPATRLFSWNPSYAQAGTYTVTFQVSDGGLTDSIEVNITVNQVNRAPLLEEIGDQIVNEGQTLEFTVTAIDPDGDELTYTASGLPEGASFDPATRLFSWTPSYAQAGTYTITFQVSDGGLTDSEEVNITVNQVNRAPLLEEIGDQIVDEGQTLEFAITAVDPDGDELTYTASGLPEGAGFDPVTRLFSWNPSYAQAGTYTITFQVSDGGLTDSVEVNITVNQVNRAPLLEEIGDQIVDEGQTLEFAITAVDPDGDELTYTVSGLPEGAGFDPVTRLFSWNPSYAQAGTYTITFQVSDGGLTDSIEVNITVNQVNRAPEFETISDQTVDVGQLLEFAITAVDPDGDELTYTASGLPEGAGFDPATRLFSWTPGYGQAGIYEVLFEATDGLLKAQAIVNITVNESPDLEMMIKALIEKLIRLIEKSKLPSPLKSIIISQLRELLDYEFTESDLNKIKALLNLIKAQGGKKITGEANDTVECLREKIDRFHDRWEKEKHKDHNHKQDKDKQEEKDPKHNKENKQDHKQDKDKQEEKDPKHNKENKQDHKGAKDCHQGKDQKQAKKDHQGKNNGKK